MMADIRSAFSGVAKRCFYPQRLMIQYKKADNKAQYTIELQLIDVAVNTVQNYFPLPLTKLITL